jgi:hypothetical protein
LGGFRLSLCSAKPIAAEFGLATVTHKVVDKLEQR